MPVIGAPTSTYILRDVEAVKKRLADVKMMIDMMTFSNKGRNSIYDTEAGTHTKGLRRVA